MTLRETDEIRRLEIGRRCAGDRIAQRLRRHPVLAVAAVVIATEHTERKRECAGVGVEERFLLDRIDLQRGRVTTRHPQHSILVVADFADALQSVQDLAAMSAGEAADRVVFQLLVQLTFGGPGGQHLAERRFLETGHAVKNTPETLEIHRIRRRWTKRRILKRSAANTHEPQARRMPANKSMR